MATEAKPLDARTVGELRQSYQDHLFRHLLPYWLEKAIDEEHGGYYTGFSNSGGRLLHNHKFTWSQGRFVWVWARLACQFAHTAEAPQYLRLARPGEFLMKHALLPTATCLHPQPGGQAHPSGRAGQPQAG